MWFLAPAFLVGLGALAVPVLLHLIERERRRTIEFPSLMFLRRIPYKSVRRRRIRHWALLAMRLAALLLIVTAFARPFIGGETGAVTAAAGPREVVVLLDRSASMGYADAFERARAAAMQAVGSLAAGDRGSLILFAAGADAVVRSSPDAARMRAAVEEAAPGSGATRFGPALRLAQSILATSTLPRREVVLISDFQANGWDRDAVPRLPEGTTVTPVSVATDTVANVSVSGVTLQRGSFSGQERIGVTAALINRGASAVGGLPVSLEIDGRPVATERVDIDARGSASVSFAPFTQSAERLRGTVRIAEDALAADNAFHFVAAQSRAVPVLIADQGAGAASLYLSQALAIGTAPRFTVRRAAPEQFTNAELAAGTVIVLNDVVPSAGQLARLQAAIEAGAGLLVVAGERAAWPAVASDLLAGTPGAIVDRAAARAGLLATIDLNHAVLEPFRAPRSGELSAARFFRYRTVTSEPAGVIARFDDGAVALAERRVGQGRTAVWASTFDVSWNDLAIKPLFLPFVHGLVTYLAQHVEPAAWQTVGGIVDPTTLPNLRLAAPQELTVLSPAGDRIPLAGAGGQAVELATQGFYEIRSERGTGAELVAANLDPAESDLTPVDPREIVAAVTGTGADVPTSAQVALTPADHERRWNLWWYLGLAALALLAGETVLSNRLARQV